MGEVAFQLQEIVSLDQPGKQEKQGDKGHGHHGTDPTLNDQNRTERVVDKG
jgi:hypothetical protein